LTFQYLLATPITIDRGSLPFALVDATGAVTVLPSAQAPTPLAGVTAYRAYQSLPVVQTDGNVNNEILGSSDGSSNQNFSLQRAPLIDVSLVVSVNEGAGPVVWTRVDSLFQSGPEDAVYQVRRDENGTVWIEFGGPPYGRAPLAGVLNNISASYCVGGGAKGNVAALAISKPVTAVDKLKLVANLAPATGGSEAEDSTQAAQRAPQQFRSGGRAVTAADFVTLAQAFGFPKAQAKAVGWNRVRMVVAPEGGGQPSSTLVEDFQNFLAPKIMLGAQVEIGGPLFTPVYLDVTVFYIPQYSAALIQQQVAQAVAALLAFDALNFNQTIYISKIYEVIQEIDGVAGLNIATFAAGPVYAAGALPPTGQLVFGQVDPGELPQWQGFDNQTSHLTLQPGSGP
jgi:predicted phage baseplate assembly protein